MTVSRIFEEILKTDTRFSPGCFKFGLGLIQWLLQESFEKTKFPSSVSTQLNFNFSFEAEIALFSDNTATHTPNRESSKVEQDFKYFNWKLQMLEFIFLFLNPYIHSRKMFTMNREMNFTNKFTSCSPVILSCFCSVGLFFLAHRFVGRSLSYTGLVIFLFS